jgi:hypothetical protein
VLVAAAAVNLLLRFNDLRAWGSAVSVLALAGVLLHAFIKSGRDTRPAQTWAESWRPRHLLMQTAWVLVPILLACVPHVDFRPHRNTLELADTSVSRQHWSRRS